MFLKYINKKSVDSLSTLPPIHAHTRTPQKRSLNNIFRKKSFLTSSLVLATCLFFASLFIPSLLDNAHADDYEKWGLESNDVFSGTGNLIIDNDITDDAGVTLGGATLTATGDLSVQSSNLLIKDNTEIDAGTGINFRGGYANSAGGHTVTNNSVSVNNSKLDNGTNDIEFFGGLAEGGTSDDHKHTVTNNSIYVNNSKLESDSHILFSSGRAQGNAAHTVTNNTLHIANSELIDAATSIQFFGGDAKGGTTADHKHTVTNNSIYINNSKLESAGYIWISSGRAFIDTTDTAAHTVTNNTLHIANSELTAVDIGLMAGVAKGTGTTTNNTVILSGIVKVTADKNINLGGGFGGNNMHTGNTLILDSATVTLVSENNDANVKNFENYYFKSISHANIINKTPTLLADNISLGSDAQLSMGSIQGGSTRLPVGQEFTLMKANSNLSGNFENIDKIFKVNQGISVSYDVTVKQTANGAPGELIATVDSASAQAQSKVPAQAQLGNIAHLNQAGNLIAGAGINNARSATSLIASNNASAPSAGGQIGTNSLPWVAFGAFNGGQSRYGSGSHVDVNGFSLLAGLAKHSEFASNNNLLYGVFFEYGKSDIESHHSLANQASVSADGDSEYYGAGLFTRIDHSSNLYAEASVRLGTSEVTQNSNNYAGLVGQNIGYSTSGLYYGAHLGLGYLWEITDSATLDIYTKYFYTHQEGDSATIAGDPYNFDDSDSSRIRLGARYSHAITSYLEPYLGAAYEHEFDGDSSYSVHNLSAGTPTLEGDTGIFEGGIKLKSSESTYLDVGLEGYLGEREGITGKFQFVFEF